MANFFQSMAPEPCPQNKHNTAATTLLVKVTKLSTFVVLLDANEWTDRSHLRYQVHEVCSTSHDVKVSQRGSEFLDVQLPEE